MTVKEFKDIINSIDSKYDNKEVLTENKEYNEYCLGKDDYYFECYDKLKKLLRDYYINEKGDNICSE